MTTQLPLQLKLEQHTCLDDYIGSASATLLGLNGAVLVYGASASGKSHLLQGICRHADEAGQRAIYLSDLSTLQANVLEGLESADLVCIDDVQALIGKPDWELALFHLLNACKDAEAKLVLATAVPPKELMAQLPDLSSRLRAAYQVMTDELDDEQKLEVIRRKAHRLGFEMNEEVCRFILARSRRDMRHLAHLVEQLDIETLQKQKKVTIPFVKQALGL